MSNNDQGSPRPIARRDFLQGAAITTLATGLAPELGAAAEAEKLAQTAPGYYPPTRLDMRGSHPGSFEAAHELRDGDFWNGATALHDTGEEFDLVVVGGGISGLSAAYFYRQANQRQDPDPRQSRRFRRPCQARRIPCGRPHLADNGGTLEIDSPYPYSKSRTG